MAVCDTEIEITGELKDQAALDALVEAIVFDQPTQDWTDHSVDNDDDALLALSEAAKGGVLAFAENERNGESFPCIEAACRKHGLSFIRTVGADDEFDTPGSRTVWHPTMTEPREFPGVDAGEGAMVGAKEVLDLMEAGRFDELKVLLALSIDPKTLLKDAFTAADGLLAANAPAM